MLQQLGLVDQVEAQVFAARRIVRPSGDLNQAPAAVLEAIARDGVAKILATFVLGLGWSWPPDLAGVNQLARLMTNLRNERGHALGANNLEPTHGRVEDRNKNAGFVAGVR